MGVKANIMMVLCKATRLSVNSRQPLVSWLRTNTIAMQGAAARRIRPAL